MVMNVKEPKAEKAEEEDFCCRAAQAAEINARALEQAAEKSAEEKEHCTEKRRQGKSGQGKIQKD